MLPQSLILAAAVVVEGWLVRCCGNTMQKHLLSVNHSRLPTIIFYMEKQFPVDSSGPMRERTKQTFLGNVAQRLSKMLVSLGELWGNVNV